MKYKFSTRSQEALQSCHPDLRQVAEVALERTAVDFAVVEGHRSLERQKLLYISGKSKLDGFTHRSKHNEKPSRAFDICAIVRRKASWRECYLAYLGGIIMATASELLAAGRITHDLRWGGNWDGDGEIITDQSFIDLPHFELKGGSK